MKFIGITDTQLQIKKQKNLTADELLIYSVIHFQLSSELPEKGFKYLSKEFICGLLSIDDETFRKSISRLDELGLINVYNNYYTLLSIDLRKEVEQLVNEPRADIYKDLKYNHKDSWSQKILQRDHFTCQECKRNIVEYPQLILHAHHIRRKADFPELQFDIDNGICLCEDCHRKTLKHEKEFEDKYFNLLNNKN